MEVSEIKSNIEKILDNNKAQNITCRAKNGDFTVDHNKTYKLAYELFLR